MHSVPSKLFALDALFAKPLSRFLALSSLAMALHSGPAFAADACTNADLSGAYVYSVNATSLTVPPVGPLAILGKITLDGKGKFAGTIQPGLCTRRAFRTPAAFG